MGGGCTDEIKHASGNRGMWTRGGIRAGFEDGVRMGMSGAAQGEL